MSEEISEERIQELLKKWGPILDENRPLSSCKTAILIEAQESWCYPENKDNE